MTVIKFVQIRLTINQSFFVIMNKYLITSFISSWIKCYILYVMLVLLSHVARWFVYLCMFQELYVALNEPDGVLGVSAIRKEEPTLREQIMEHESIGK